MIHKTLQKVVAALPFTNGTTIAGGSIASLLLKEPVNDWDVTFSSISDVDRAIAWSRADKNVNVICETPNAVTIKCAEIEQPIQLIRVVTGEPRDMIQTFDYVHTTNFYNIKDGLVINTAAASSLLQKKLVYVGTKYPVAALFRLRKFLSRGWTIDVSQIIKMALQVSYLDLRDPEVFAEQVRGVDESAISEAMIANIGNFEGMLDEISRHLDFSKNETYV